MQASSHVATWNSLQNRNHCLLNSTVNSRGHAVQFLVCYSFIKQNIMYCQTSTIPAAETSIIYCIYSNQLSIPSLFHNLFKHLCTPHHCTYSMDMPYMLLLYWLFILFTLNAKGKKQSPVPCMCTHTDSDI